MPGEISNSCDVWALGGKYVIVQADAEKIESFTADVTVIAVFAMEDFAVFKPPCRRKILNCSSVIFSLHRASRNYENGNNNDCENQLLAFVH